MASPLEYSTAEEQRAVIRFLVSQGVRGSAIYGRMVKVYGNNCLNRSNVYKWMERFKAGRESTSDEPRSGRPVEVSTSSLESRIVALIRDNRRITVELIAKELRASTGTVHKIMQNKLHYMKTCEGWMPKQVTDDQPKEPEILG